MLRMLFPLALGLVALTHAQVVGVPDVEQPLTPKQVHDLEQAVQRNPTDIATRLQLLRHYAMYPKAGFSSRLRHSLYFIEHLPADPNASTPLTYVPLRDAVAHNTLRDAWMQALQRFPNEDRVLINAVRFLYREHPQEAEQRLRQALERSPASRTLAANLGYFYVLHILGLSSPADTTSTRLPELHEQLRQSAVRQLERTSNPYVLTAAGRALRNLYPRSRFAMEGAQEPLEFAERLIRRGLESAGPNDTVLHARLPLIEEFMAFLRPDMPDIPWFEIPRHLATASREPFPTLDRVGEQGPRLIEKPVATYPAMAKEARIQGVVLFRLLIDEEGRVESVTLLSGHPLLVPSATEAVRRYRYQPTTRDGQPVKVRADVGVPFVLQ